MGYYNIGQQVLIKDHGTSQHVADARNPQTAADIATALNFWLADRRMPMGEADYQELKRLRERERRGV